MSKKMNRKFRKVFKPFLFGAVLSGALLLPGFSPVPGTGALYNSLFGQTNENYDISAGGNLTLSDTINYGLIGGAGSETLVSPSTDVLINGTGWATVGKLNTTGTSPFSVTDAVDMTFSDGVDLIVGQDGASSTTNLVVVGTSAHNSILTIESGSVMQLLDGAVLTIGADGGSMTGAVAINGALTGMGTDNDILIYQNSSLTLGNDVNVLNLEGTTKNYGTFTIHGGSSTTPATVNFGKYSDNANGKLLAENSTVSILQGTSDANYNITINGELSAYQLKTTNVIPHDSNYGKMVFASTSTIDVADVITIGSGSYEAGAGGNLTINSTGSESMPGATFGGLQIWAEQTDGTEGTLTIAENAKVNVTGLTEKFDVNGTRGSTADDTYRFDMWLDSSLTVAGSLDLSSGDLDNPKTIGIRFGNDPTDTTTTISSTISGTVTADTLLLAGNGEAKTAITPYNELVISGTLRVNNSLTFDNYGSDTLNVNNTGNVSVGDMTLDDSTIAFTSTGSFAASGALTIDGGSFTAAPTTALATTISSLNLNSGSFTANSSKGTFEIGNVNIGDEGIGSGTMTVGEGTTVSLGTTKLSAGTLQTAGTLTGLSAGSPSLTISDSGILNVAGFSESAADPTATISNMAVNLEGNGKITNTNNADTLLFSGADVTNNSAWTDAAAISAGVLAFEEGSTYTNSAATDTASLEAGTIRFSDSLFLGNKNVATNLLQFSGLATNPTTLSIAADETIKIAPLTVTASPELQVNRDVFIDTWFDPTQSATGTDMVVFSGDNAGKVNLATGSKIILGNDNLSQFTKGETYTRTFVAEAANSTYNSTYENTAFYSLSGTDNGNGGLVLNLSVHATKFADFGSTPNLLATGSYIDSFRYGSNVSTELSDLVNDIAHVQTAEEVKNALDQLSGVQRANSLMLAMDDPWNVPFDLLSYGKHRTQYGLTPGTYGQEFLGQMNGYGQTPLRSALYNGELLQNSFWGVAYHTSYNANSDGNSADYGISRTGTRLGFDWINSMDTVAGITFGYSRPYLYSESQKTEMNNYHLGLYAGHQYAGNTDLKFYVGYGIQDYTSNRSVDLDSLFYDKYQSSYNGQSLAAALRLSQDWMLDEYMVLRPLLQFDTQQVWQDAVVEEGGVAALSYDKSSWNRSFARAGFESEFNTPFFQFTGRAIYGLQLGGEAAPEMTASFVNVSNGGNMLIQGVDLGESFGDVGVGALGYFDCEKRWSISGNYDYTFSKESGAHTGVVSSAYSF